MTASNLEWHCPIRLVSSGVIGELWRSQDLERGNATAASVLPVLALHVRPESARTSWTGTYRLPYLKVAELSGVGHGSVGTAMERLKSAGLLRKWKRYRAGGELAYVDAKKSKNTKWMVFYRLNAKVYPQEGERGVTLPASLFLSRTWADLQSAGRPLYLVLLGLEDYPVTHSELGELSGLPKRTLLRTLKTLRQTIVDGKPLVEGFRANTVVSK